VYKNLIKYIFPFSLSLNLSVSSLQQKLQQKLNWQVNNRRFFPLCNVFCQRPFLLCFPSINPNCITLVPDYPFCSLIFSLVILTFSLFLYLSQILIFSPRIILLCSQIIIPTCVFIRDYLVFFPHSHISRLIICFLDFHPSFYPLSLPIFHIVFSCR
jgi:hypothetical protein